MLRDNFGRPNIIARAYVDKLSAGPLIKADDANGLVTFARDVEECNVTLGHLKYFSDLNNFKTFSKSFRDSRSSSSVGGYGWLQRLSKQDKKPVSRTS